MSSPRVSSDPKPTRIEKAITKASSAAAAIKQTAERPTQISPPKIQPSSPCSSSTMAEKRTKVQSKGPSPAVSREPSPRPTREDMVDDKHGFTSPHTHATMIAGPGQTQTPVQSGRKSLLYLTPKRGPGIEMDLATKEANEILQRGKAALEAAGNMKKECKLIAYESLQQLYEAFLCIADSRARHKCNLEKERSQHAQQLLQVEKAHAKDMDSIRQQWTALLGEVREVVQETLHEAKAVRSWLGYETETPFRTIEQLHIQLTALEKTRTKESSKIGHTRESSETCAPKWKLLEESLVKMTTKITSVSNQIQALQNKVEDLDLELKTSTPAVNLDCFSPPQANQHDCPASKQILALEEKINTLQQLTREALERPLTAVNPPPINIASHLEPIKEKLHVVSSDLKELREEKSQAPVAPTISLQQDLALAEVRESLAKIQKKVERKTIDKSPLGPLTFAQVTSKPPRKVPNHTLIIGSKVS